MEPGSVSTRNMNPTRNRTRVVHKFAYLLVAACACLHSLLAASNPWPPQFNLTPWETDRLTAADVVGPDGIVYPDWRRAGVPGGIPNLGDSAVLSKYKNFPLPAQANDAVVAAIFTEALAHARSGGKALISFAAGTYHLSNALPKLDTSNVVVRGAGMEKTLIEIAPGGQGRALFDTGPKIPWQPPYLDITGPVLRGATVLPVKSTKGLAVGDFVGLQTLVSNELPPDATMRQRYDWPASKTFYTNQYGGHFGRLMLARVAAVSESSLTLDRPVSHDYYADEPIQLRRAGLVSGVGIQDLTITSAPGVKMDPIFWDNVADSWLLRVAVRKPANWPLGYGSNLRLNSEIRNCVFDGTQANINNGSTAYLGWSGWMTDCLMAGVKANDLRHMGIFQGAIRSVIRDCTFTGATVRSPQFHGQFPTDNLIEGTTFDVKSEVWTVDGMATLRHGVEGPRNVLYNCRFPSCQGSTAFNGGVEGHILAYNRWPMGDNENWRDSPIMAFDRTWNTIIRGNVIQADPRYPFATLNDLSCQGWNIRDNTIHGSNGLVAQGDGSVLVNDRNRILPLDAPMTDPRPEAPSILDWQRANADKPRLVVMPLTSAVLAPGTATTLRVTRVKTDPANDLAVRLKVDPDRLPKLPETLTIPAGANFADFTIRHDSAGTGEVTIAAEANGILTGKTTVTVLDAPPKPADWLQADSDHRALGLPDGWRLADFGRPSNHPAPATIATWANNTLTLTGGGIACATDRNIHLEWRTQAWQTLEGDGSITARLESASPTAQTGLIITDDAAPVTECTVLLADGTVLSTGASNEGTAQALLICKGDGSKAPVWLRLERKGGVFTAWRATVTEPTDADWNKLATVDVYADPPQGEEHYRSQAKWDARIHVGILLNTTQPNSPAMANYSHIAVTSSTQP
jgi:hypothetical protein